MFVVRLFVSGFQSGFCCGFLGVFVVNKFY